MTCLSREPGPAFGWVELGIDVGQKPVEGPTAQPPLQLLAFSAVRLASLGRRESQVAGRRKLVLHHSSCAGKHRGVWEQAEGGGQQASL